MAHDLLCKWLDLPPHPWPPDHYALLNLTPGTGNGDEIEERVLERMEGLRHYQLMHPDAVTEGMNLLAQAMICLTDPEARQEYDRGLGVESNQADLPSEDEEVADEIPKPPSSSVRTAASVKLPPPPLPPSATVEEPLPEPILILELGDETAPQDDAGSDEGESLEIPRAIFEDEKQKESDAGRDTRRRLYREIVGVRQVVRIWQRLLGYLDQAGKTFARRTDTVAFMNELADLRPLLGTVSNLVGEPNEPGHLIATLARQQLVVEMFRSFLPSQREALAKDCRSALAVLTQHYRDLRKDVRRLTAKSFKRRFTYPLYRHLAARPEWLLLFLGLVALAIAFVRSVPK